MTMLATVEELEKRLDWDLSDREREHAEEALIDASELVRAHGSQWEADTAPPLAKRIALKAAARYMNNPEGYTQSRAGDESLSWADDRAAEAGVYLTDSEVALIKALMKRPAIMTAPLTAWGTTEASVAQHGRAQTVPVAPTGSPFPYFVGDGPW